MKIRILAAVGIVFGSAILLSGVLNGVKGEGTYAQGQIAGLIFGVLLFAVGLYYLIKGRRKDTYLK
jgi:membrane associated rhomboid family serine protease